MKSKRTAKSVTGEVLPEQAPAKAEANVQPAVSKVTKTEPHRIDVAITTGLDEMLDDLCPKTGTRQEVVAVQIIAQIAESIVRPRPKDTNQSLIQAISMIAEIAPQNFTEAMLATQMIGTHEAAMYFTGIATQSGQTLERCEAAMRWGTRLMRLHLDQIEALQKLRGKSGQQKVVVEHVHVHQGGQAIVGAVAAGPGGGSK